MDERNNIDPHALKARRMGYEPVLPLCYSHPGVDRAVQHGVPVLMLAVRLAQNGLNALVNAPWYAWRRDPMWRAAQLGATAAVHCDDSVELG